MDEKTRLCVECKRTFRCEDWMHRDRWTGTSHQSLQETGYEKISLFTWLETTHAFIWLESRWTRVALDESGTLSRVSKSSAGHYRCSADNGLESAIHTEFHLHVLGMKLTRHTSCVDLFYPPLAWVCELQSKWGAFSSLCVSFGDRTPLPTMNCHLICSLNFALFLTIVRSVLSSEYFTSRYLTV